MKSNANLTGDKLKQIENELKSTDENIFALSTVADLSDWFREIENSSDILRRAELLVQSESKLKEILSNNSEKTSGKHQKSSDGSNFVVCLQIFNLDIYIYSNICNNI